MFYKTEGSAAFPNPHPTPSFAHIHSLCLPLPSHLLPLQFVGVSCTEGKQTVAICATWLPASVYLPNAEVKTPLLCKLSTNSPASNFAGWIHSISHFVDSLSYSDVGSNTQISNTGSGLASRSPHRLMAHLMKMS